MDESPCLLMAGLIDEATPTSVSTMLGSAMITIRPMAAEEDLEVARLIHRSTNHWYETHHHRLVFPGEPEDCLIFPETYEALDPGHSFVAVGSGSKKIIGSCFHHPRSSHHTLGIMNADPAYRGAAKALLQHLIELAKKDHKPLRLVSSAGNLDSFSLYNRHGFTPYAVYQDMTIEVPPEGLPLSPSAPATRPAEPSDLKAIVRLEEELVETSRAKDWQHFIANPNGVWRTTVSVDSNKHPTGAIASIDHPGSRMIGPAIAPDVPTLLALLLTQLNLYPGPSPLFLVPSEFPELTQALYALGARNHEIHLAQSLGPPPKRRGLSLPTFLPETA